MLRDDNKNCREKDKHKIKRMHFISRLMTLTSYSQSQVENYCSVRRLVESEHVYLYLT